MDTDRAERAKKAKELQSIFETVLTQGHDLLNAERATLWMLDDDDDDDDNVQPENKVLWSRVATGTNKGIIQAPVKGSLVGECVLTGNVINVQDVYQDGRFDKRVDAQTGFTTRSVLCHPVRHADTGKIIGAIQIVNKKKNMSTAADPNGQQQEDNDNDDDDKVFFTDNDVKLVQMLASHVACFIKVVRGTSD
jgi:adenylate cyclase